MCVRLNEIDDARTLQKHTTRLDLVSLVPVFRSDFVYLHALWMGFDVMKPWGGMGKCMGGNSRGCKYYGSVEGEGV